MMASLFLTVLNMSLTAGWLVLAVLVQEPFSGTPTVGQTDHYGSTEKIPSCRCGSGTEREGLRGSIGGSLRCTGRSDFAAAQYRRYSRRPLDGAILPYHEDFSRLKRITSEGGDHMDNGASSYRRFLDGDESAFDEIMKELFYPLVFFVNRYVQDVHTAEDIAMDVFSELIVHRHRYHFKVSLKTYLFMLGRSRALDCLRHRKVLNMVELSEAVHTDDGTPALEELVLTDERKQAVNAALAQLPEQLRTVVHLIYFEDLSYEEAAAVMKKNRKQVDNLLYRAKKELRIMLGKDGEWS